MACIEVSTPHKSISDARQSTARSPKHYGNDIEGGAVQLIDIADEEAPRYRPARDPEAYIAQGRAFALNAYSAEAGHLFRHEAGHRTDLKPASIPI